MQVIRDRVRKGKIDHDTFQFILGHKDLSPGLDTMFSSMFADYRLSKPIIERPPFLIVTADQYKKHNSPKKLECAVNAAGHRLCDWSKDILRRMTVSGEIPESDVEFVDATNAELGYFNGCTVAETYEAAAKIGLVLCHSEDGPLARMAYTEQPMNDWRLMAMEPISDSDGCRGVFFLGRSDDGSWLSGDIGDPDNFCLGFARWVFRRK